MNIVRIYTGEDKKSHFQEMEFPFTARGSLESTPIQAASGVIFNRYPAGFVADWHPAPQRQYVVTISGHVEIEVGDGTVKLFGPGDVLLAEDLTGQGHITRVVGDRPRSSMWVPLTE